MKLNSFVPLHEQQSIIKNFGDAALRDVIHRLIETVKTRTKMIVLTNDEKFEDSQTDLTLKFSNSVFDFLLEIEVDFESKFTGEESFETASYSVNASGLINKNYYAPPGSSFVGPLVRLRTMDKYEIIQLLEDAGFDSNMTDVLELIGKMTDWYFDITSEYGKLKLQSVEDGVVAIGGKFSTEKQKAEIFQ